MEQQKVVQKVAQAYPLLNKQLWISEVHYQDGTKSYGVGDSKQESEDNVNVKFADLSVPTFITRMGSVNSDYKSFTILSNGMKYIKDNTPHDIYMYFLPVVCVNPEAPQNVALVCEDLANREFFYVHSNKATFKESLDSCIKELIITYFNNPEPSENVPKINSWIINYLKKQKLGSFDTYIHG